MTKRKKPIALHVDAWQKGGNPCSRGGWTVSNPEAFDEHDRTDFHGEVLTISQLELMAIVDGLIQVRSRGTVFSDSEFCVKTLNGEYRVSKKNCLQPLFFLGTRLMEEKKAKVKWVPRDDNVAGVSNEKILKHQRKHGNSDPW